MPTQVIDPFGDDKLDDILLADAPLLRVLTQVRFPPLSVLSKNLIEQSLSPIVAELSKSFPIYEQGHEMQVEIGPQGVRQSEGSPIATMQSGDSKWKLSLGPSFLSLETSSYVSRPDFLKRLQEVLNVVFRHIAIPRFDRIGCRYTNRIDDPSRLARIDQFVRPAVLGGFGVGQPSTVKMAHSLSDTLYVADGYQLGARWGFLPPNGNIDPSLPASTLESWTLDLDAYDENPRTLDADGVVTAVERLSNVANRYFRWVITDDFLKEFGGEADDN